MGLKCSVLGHAYGETTVERDREERGSEVVITIRELETCNRCGDTRVVTENKEVTTIETPDDEPDVTAADAMAAMEGDGADVGDSTGETTDASADASDAGASTQADTASASDADGAASESLVEDAEGGAAVTGDSVGTPAPDAVEDQGAEILDDESDDQTDAETDPQPVDDELADPTLENDTDVPGATGEEGDAVILDDGPASGPADETAANPVVGDEGVTHSPDAGDSATGESGESDDAGEDPLGEWPEETLRDTDDDWTPSEELSGTVDDVDPDAEVDREYSTSSAVTVPEGEFHCEGCGYSTAVEASSLRAGDFCPECHSETLVHRPEE